MELNKKFKEKQMSENFILGIMLALCGGFLDAYTYITRGGVFANAQTGNIVLMGINIAKGDFERVIHYVVPILAFALGILISEVIKATLKKNTHMHWRQIIVLAEIIILIICGFIPSGKGNTFVNVMVSFVCSLQVESFRVINGNTVATTMCTGNLRSGTELLFLGISKKDKSIAIRSLTYYGINLFFVIGAIVGAVVTKYLDVKSVFIASALLIIPFIMMFKSSENVGINVQNEFDDVEVLDVTQDSRLVKEGSLFICIKGAAFDGHSVAKEMLDKGAAAVVVEHDLGIDKQIIVENSRAVYSPICANFFGNPADKLKLIGLTGTNGKTTTTFLIKQILENVGKKVGLIGTVQNMVGDEIYPAKYTTPDPYELQKLFSLMVKAGCEYCVMEVSSQALAQGRVNGLRFALGAFTNLTQDHLDYHKTWENYFASKRILFENCDIAVTNADDEHGLKIIDGLEFDKVVTYAVDTNDATYTAKNVKFKASGVEYEIVSNDSIGRCTCPIPGRFSVYNSLCATTCALALGIDFDDVLSAVSKSQGVKGRIEVVPSNRDFTIIIDYAHSPDGLENIITSLKEIAKGRVVTLFGCGGDRDKTKRPKMGKIAAELSDYCIVTSDNPRSENPSAIIDDILVGMKNIKTPYKVIENRHEAIEYAITHAKKDDIILLAGKGHETYQILPTGTIHFDEREVIAEVLGKMN